MMTLGCEITHISRVASQSPPFDCLFDSLEPAQRSAVCIVRGAEAMMFYEVTQQILFFFGRIVAKRDPPTRLWLKRRSKIFKFHVSKYHNESGQMCDSRSRRGRKVSS